MLAAVLAVLAPQFAESKIHDPSEHASPDGSYTLEVEPSSPLGTGPAGYRLEREGELVWERELPFLLTEVAALDTGHVVGYSEVRAPNRHLEQDFVVAVIDPAGELVLEERIEEVPARYVHGRSHPSGFGLIVDPDQDRFVVRIDESYTRESWWVYRISAGERVDELVPGGHLSAATSGRAILQSGHFLPGSELFLVHWRNTTLSRIVSGGLASDGASFSLHDADDARLVWQLDLPHDYEVEGGEFAFLELHEFVREVGAVLDTSEPGSFSLWHVRDGERVTYRIERDGDSSAGWRVEESGRVAFEPPRLDPKPGYVLLPRLDLERLDDVQLEAPDAQVSGPLDEVVGWGFDDPEGLRAVCRSERGEFSEVRIDFRGEVVGTQALVLDEELLDLELWWIHTGGSAWIVLAQSNGGYLGSEAFRVDASDGAVARLALFSAPRRDGALLPIEEVVPTEDGGFVALAEGWIETGRQAAVARFDRDGDTLWRIDADSREDSVLRNPKSVTVTSEGQVAVADGMRIVFLEEDGELFESVDLEDLWGEELGDLAFLRRAPGDGILVGTGGGTLRHTDARVRPVASFTPRTERGLRAAELAEQARFGPGGELWSFDGCDFVRLDDEGRVAERLRGRGFFGSNLRPWLGAVFDGRVYAQDPRTGLPLAWDESGAFLFRGEAIAEGAARSLPSTVIRQGFDRSVWFSGFLDRGSTGWSSEGERLGYVDRSEPLAVSPDGARIVFGASPGVVIEDREGNVLARIERQPDRRWIRHLRATTFLADGTLALVHGEVTRDFQSRFELLFYDETGRAIRRLELPHAGVGLHASGRWLVMRGAGPEALLLDLEEERQYRARLGPRPSRDSWALGLSQDGERLLLLDLDEGLLRRFRLK